MSEEGWETIYCRVGVSVSHIGYTRDNLFYGSRKIRRLRARKNAEKSCAIFKPFSVSGYSRHASECDPCDKSNVRVLCACTCPIGACMPCTFYGTLCGILQAWSCLAACVLGAKAGYEKGARKYCTHVITDDRSRIWAANCVSM